MRKRRDAMAGPRIWLVSLARHVAHMAVAGELNPRPSLSLIIDRHRLAEQRFRYPGSRVERGSLRNGRTGKVSWRSSPMT